MTNTFFNTQWLTRNSSVTTIEALIDMLMKTYKVFSCPFPSRWNREGCRSLFGRKIDRNRGRFIWSMRFDDACAIYTPLQYQPEFTRILFGYLGMPTYEFDKQVANRKALLEMIRGVMLALASEIDRREAACDSNG